MRNGLAHREGLFKAAEISAGENFVIVAGFRALHEVERGRVFDVVDGFDVGAAQPKADEIFAWAKKDFAKEESGLSGLASAEAHEISFLSGIGIDYARAGAGIIKDDSKIGGGKIGVATEFDLDAEVATGEGDFNGIAGGIEGLNGDGGEAGFAVAVAGTGREVGAGGDVKRFGVVAGSGIWSAAIELNCAAGEDDAARAEGVDGSHAVRDEDDGAAGAGDIAHFAEAFFLEVDVADGEDFIDEEDFGFEVSGDGESETDVHAGGVVLDGGIDELFEFGEGDDFVELGGDFAAGHAEDGAGEEGVFAAGEFRMEACADFEEGADAAADFGESGGGAGDAGKDFEEGGFAGAVASDQAEDFAFADLERDVAESPEKFVLGAAKGGEGRTEEAVESVAEAGVGDGGAVVALGERFGLDDGGHEGRRLRREPSR